MTSPGRATPHAHAGIPGPLLLGPPVAGHIVQRDEERHAFVIDQQLILCTPTEYRVLTLLLEQVDRCVRYAHLIAQFQAELTSSAAQRKRDRTRLMHLVSDVRSKIWVFDWDIVAVMNTGYILLSSHQEEPVTRENKR